jgi:hypothetical protein
MTRLQLTLREKSARLASWVALIGANLIALMTYLILWVENPRRLPIILAFIPLQVVTNTLLIRWRADWKRIRVMEWLTFAVLGWLSWSCIHNREWYFLAAVAFGWMLLIWRFRRLEKREVHDGFEE